MDTCKVRDCKLIIGRTGLGNELRKVHLTNDLQNSLLCYLSYTIRRLYFILNKPLSLNISARRWAAATMKSTCISCYVNNATHQHSHIRGVENHRVRATLVPGPKWNLLTSFLSHLHKISNIIQFGQTWSAGNMKRSCKMLLWKSSSKRRRAHLMQSTRKAGR